MLSILRTLKDDSMEITGKLFNHQTNELLTEEALSNDNEWRLLDAFTYLMFSMRSPVRI